MTDFKLRIDDGRHRQATWLELFFDLAFVICVSSVTHVLIGEPDAHGFLTFLLLFFPVWWCWNQYTWFSSHFDNDGAFSRLHMLWGIFGALFLSKGIEEFHHGHSRTLIFSYIFMHLGMLLAWFRAYRNIGAYRPYIRFKASGVVLGILTWGISLGFEEIGT